MTDTWQACERTVLQYMCAYDHQDVAGCLSLLTEDIRFDLDSGTGVGRDAYRQHLQKPRPEGSKTHHHVSSFVLVKHTDRSATGTYLLLIPYQLPQNNKQKTGFLSRRYEDEFRKVDNTWCICMHRFVEEIIN